MKDVRRDRVRNPYGGADDIVFRNMADPIIYLYRRKTRSGKPSMSEQQFAAAMRYRDAYLTVGGQYGLGMDWERPVVDVSGFSDRFSERQADAAKELAAANSELETAQIAVMISIVGEHRTITETAHRMTGSRSRHRERMVRGLLMDSLDTLAELWGLSGGSEGGRRRGHVWRGGEGGEVAETDWAPYVDPGNRQRKRRK